MIENLRPGCWLDMYSHFTSNDREAIERQLDHMLSAPPAEARVLVFEEEPIIAQLMADILSFGGYEVVTTSCVEDAILQTLTHSFDLAFLDVSTDTAGIAFAAKMAVTLLPETPVVLTTVYADRRLIMHALLCGAQALLSKPFTPGEVLEVARETLRRRTPGCKGLIHTN